MRGSGGCVRRTRLRRRRFYALLTAVALSSLLADRAIAAERQGERTNRAPTVRWIVNPLLYERLEDKIRRFAQAELRPMVSTGVELHRIDMRPTTHRSGLATDTPLKGTAAYDGLDWGLRARPVDVYATATVAPPKGILNDIALATGVWACPDCTLQPLPPHHIDTSFAGGGGAHVKLGVWAVRVECGRFMGTSHHPGFVAVGFSRSVF